MATRQAIHEAGHALSCVSRAVKVFGLGLHGGGIDSECRYARPASALDALSISLGGVSAELALLGSVDWAAADSDLRWARLELSRGGYGWHDDLFQCETFRETFDRGALFAEQFAEDLVELADALDSTREIDGAEAQRILWPARSRRPDTPELRKLRDWARAGAGARRTTAVGLGAQVYFAVLRGVPVRCAGLDDGSVDLDRADFGWRDAADFDSWGAIAQALFVFGQRKPSTAADLDSFGWVDFHATPILRLARHIWAAGVVRGHELAELVR